MGYDGIQGDIGHAIVAGGTHSTEAADSRYPHNLHALSNYFTPACQALLQQDYEFRRNAGELRQRVRGIYEIPGRGYGDNPTLRVRTLSNHEWVVTLDVTADEYYASEQVKRALVRYPLKVMRIDVDPKRNPFGLVIDCYASAPQRIATPSDTTKTTSHPEDTP
jgi:integrating conjugative element protein (TIGR03746 family)